MKLLQFLRQSIFSRILLIFLGTVIPLYFIGMEIYQWGIRSIQEQVLNNFSLQLEREVDHLESEISSIMQKQLNLTNSKEVNWFLTTYPYSSDYVRGINILELQNDLISIVESSPYVKTAYLDLPPLNIRISDKTAITHTHGTGGDYQAIIPAITGTQLIIELDGIYLYSTIAVSGQVLYSVVSVFSADLLMAEVDQAFMEEYQTFFIDSSNMTPLWKEDEKFAGFCSLLQQSQEISEGWDTAENIQLQATLDDKDWILLYEPFNEYSLSLCTAAPEDAVYRNIKNYEILFLFFSIAVLVLMTLSSILMYRSIQIPIRKLAEAFRQVDSGNLLVTIDTREKNEFDYLYQCFNQMTGSLHQLIEQSYQQRILLQKAELEQLQAQINPHFLYNSFFFLHRMIKSDNRDSALAFSKNLGLYFQYITRNSQKIVPLIREVEHAKIYCDMQNQRFEGRITVEFDNFPMQYSNVMVPRLILQPVIENCFKHGLKDKEEDGVIHIAFSADPEEQKFCIFIEDNGETTTDQVIEDLSSRLKQSEGETTGVVNIHRRLWIMFDGKGGIHVMRSDLGGMKIEIYLPLSEEQAGGGKNV